MKYLYIEVEIYVREFDSRFLLSLEAAKKSFKVFIGHRKEKIDYWNKLLSL